MKKRHNFIEAYFPKLPTSLGSPRQCSNCRLIILEYGTQEMLDEPHNWDEEEKIPHSECSLPGFTNIVFPGGCLTEDEWIIKEIIE